MNTTNYLTSLLLSVLLITMPAFAAKRDKQLTPMNKEDVTLQNIKSIFSAALFKAEFDNDGYLAIEDNGLITTIKLDKERKLITYIAKYSVKNGVSEFKKLQVANRLNNTTILVRFYVQPSVIYFDHALLYDDNVTPYTIVNNYRLYAKVIMSVLSKPENNDIVE